MEESRPQSAETPPLRSGWAASSTFKLLTLGALVLVMLIPVARLLDLVRERQARASDVRSEVASTWGGEQTLGAAVLTLPYRVPEPDGRGVRKVHLLPREVLWRGEVVPRIRSRGLFDAVVYESRLHAEGTFDALDLAELGLASEDVLWSRATLSVGVSDLRGIQERFQLRWNGAPRPFLSGVPRQGVLSSGVHVDLPESWRETSTGKSSFAFELSLRGTHRLRFLPLGEVTKVQLSSTWPDPGFSGSSVPRTRKTGAAGFTTNWEVPHFARGFPQSWHAGERPEEELRERAAASAFGVDLVRPVDHYRKAERSAKYAILFITLTFTAIFLLELLSPVRLHPVQYLLVGFALCLFYLLLLSLSEHLGFAASYTVAAGATVGLIGLYGRSLLKSWRRTVPLALSLTVLYGYLYTLLQAESLALVMGSVGLFVILALVMYLTRNLDWWTLTQEEQAGHSA